ncbi:MAG: hypothetical protein M3265_08470 [Actinomycetota bacterium]|jgi:hypothetical protein|nr:hypothetical protein [Actinomycetota bacterium]
MSTQTRVVDSIRSGARMGADLLQAVAASPMVGDVVGRVIPSGCSCEIPPPCWVPKSLGEVKSAICAGGTAVLRIRVTNCGLQKRTVRLVSAGEDEKDVNVEPAQLALGPMERGVATLTLGLPTSASSGESREALVWVLGCHDHYVRWTVTASGGSDACHELDVEDCPDLVHHWYDHFYCERPCPGHGR